MNDDLLHLLDVAATAARSAGALLQGRPARVTAKAAADFVTEVDLASEARIREVLGRLTPDIPVQGEERGGAGVGTRWVVDPLDGTTNFVHGYPSYCVSIGLCEGPRPLVGCIYDPVADALYRAARGRGAFRGEAPLRVSEVRTVADALGVTGFPNLARERAPELLLYVEEVLRHTHGVRRSGSAAMDLVAITAGQADLFWEFGLHAWDTAAGAVLVEEAGGRVSAVDGGAWAPGDASVLATNAWIHDEVVALLGRARERWRAQPRAD